LNFEVKKKRKKKKEGCFLNWGKAGREEGCFRSSKRTGERCSDVFLLPDRSNVKAVLVI
jgi:hypothetical protein